MPAYLATSLQQFPERIGETAWSSFEGRVYEETLDGRSYRTVEYADGPVLPDFGPERVPGGTIFVLGDHRDNSMESRTFGPVPNGNIVGRAHAIHFSWGRDGPRVERIGLKL